MGWLDDFTDKAGDFFSTIGHVAGNVYHEVSGDVGAVLNGAKDIVIHTEDTVAGTYNNVIDKGSRIVNTAINTGGSVLNKGLDTADDLGKTLLTSSIPLIVGGAAVAYFLLMKK